MNLGRRIYFDKLTGDVIVDTLERSGNVLGSSVEDDIDIYKELSKRNIDTFDILELEFGQYTQDFAESNHYRVNTETRELEFSYRDPNNSEVPPVYQEPLSKEVENLKQENTLLKAQNQALTERADFIEDVVAEMATQVYQ